jgi:hypothetical protein
MPPSLAKTAPFVVFPVEPQASKDFRDVGQHHTSCPQNWGHISTEFDSVDFLLLLSKYAGFC